MAHTHTHHHHHHAHESRLSWAFWLNLMFSVVEVIGGGLTNSTAIIADAFHDFADALAIGLAVVLEKLSGKKRAHGFTYGYRRFSLLSALAMSVILLAGAVLMIGSAYNGFMYPEAMHSKGMAGLAILGIVVNGFAFLKIKHSEGHAHNHDKVSAPVHDTDFNRKAIMLHLLEDVLGWVAVLTGAVVIYFTNWYWIDGVLALLIAVFIGYNATLNLIRTMKVLLQSVPENVNMEQLSRDLIQVEGVDSIHDLHLWTMDGTYNIGTLHAVVNKIGQNQQDAVRLSLLQIMEKHQIQHATIQLETGWPQCNLLKC